MSAGKIIATIAAVVLSLAAIPICIISFLFIWGAFSPEGQTGWIGIGIVGLVVGIGMIAGGIGVALYVYRKTPSSTEDNNVTLNIDLSGDVNLDQMKCQSCGGVLTMDAIKMVAGAPVVSCPYCNTTYQLTEEPKW